jgi:hypothetical protein
MTKFMTYPSFCMRWVLVVSLAWNKALFHSASSPDCSEVVSCLVLNQGPSDCYWTAFLTTYCISISGNTIQNAKTERICYCSNTAGADFTERYSGLELTNEHLAFQIWFCLVICCEKGKKHCQMSILTSLDPVELWPENNLDPCWEKQLKSRYSF